MAEDITPTKTPAERIQELNAINEQIPQILTAASTAIHALTNAPLPPSSSSPTSTTQLPTATLTAHKATFQRSTHAFFTAVSQLTTSLTAQARALEAAGIIPPTAAKTMGREMTAADLASIMGNGAGVVSGGGAMGAPSRDSEATVTNGGLGGLDVGWLNARAGDVGRGMEGEVLGRVRGILEGLVGGEGKVGGGEEDGEEKGEGGGESDGDMFDV